MPESIYIINTFVFPTSLQVLPLEVNLRNKKMLACLDQLCIALSFCSTTHDHLPDRQCYSGHLLMAAIKFYLKRRNCRPYIFFARYLLLPFLHDFMYIHLFYQGFLSQTLTIHRTAGEGRRSSFIPLYHFHPLLFATLYLR